MTKTTPVKDADPAAEAETRVAELEAQLAAMQDAIAELANRPASVAVEGGNRRVFTVNGPMPVDEMRSRIKAAHSKTIKTYIALEDGIDHQQGFIKAGTRFSTTQPKGSWMEPVED